MIIQIIFVKQLVITIKQTKNDWKMLGWGLVAGLCVDLPMSMTNRRRQRLDINGRGQRRQWLKSIKS